MCALAHAVNRSAATNDWNNVICPLILCNLVTVCLCMPGQSKTAAVETKIDIACFCSVFGMVLRAWPYLSLSELFECKSHTEVTECV